MTTPRHRSVPTLAVLAALTVGGCTTSSTSDAGPDAAVDAGTDAGLDAGADASIDGGPDAGTDAGASPCGAAAPNEGDACTREGLVCEYGTDPRRDCRTTATCTGGHFHLTVPSCTPPPVDVCPATRADAAGQACLVMDAYCTYGDLACHCTDCPRGAPLCGPITMLRWDCDAPNPDTTCPEAMPPQGGTCPTEGKTCTYSCGPGNARTCTGGVWTLADGGSCPISTRWAKRDIRYLDAQAVDAVAEDASTLRLATWEYTDPALAGRTHLGVVIEDQPVGSYAVEASRGQVDVYGYTSLVLATVQAQGRRIDALERQVAALEAERAAPLCSPP